MRNAKTFTTFGIGAVFAAAMSTSTLTPVTAHAGDAVLSGSVKSVDGEIMGGVTVSARADGANVVTSVFTDEAGNYYFPPMAEGKYKVWAQAVTFETGRGRGKLQWSRVECACRVGQRPDWRNEAERF